MLYFTTTGGRIPTTGRKIKKFSSDFVLYYSYCGEEKSRLEDMAAFSCIEKKFEEINS
jgi:hypothetical protein